MKISAEYTTEYDPKIKQVNKIIIDGSDTIILSQNTGLDLSELSPVVGLEIRNVYVVGGGLRAMRFFLGINNVSKFSTWLIKLICKIELKFNRKAREASEPAKYGIKLSEDLK